MKEFKIDKISWKKVKLGDIAEDISVRVDNPFESEYTRFVGLEHFISGDLKINDWSNTNDLVSSTKAFLAGDVLFARRNAYLRRASLVEFDGICSGDAFVLREKQKKLIPGFLAFLVNSESLWDFANANAAGTMSKRVKWRDLANFEFFLPPKDQQEKLAELLWALNDIVGQYSLLIERLDAASKVSLIREFHNLSGGPIESLGEIGRWISGSTPSKKNSSYWNPPGILWITPKDMKCSLINDSEDKLSKKAIDDNLITLHPKDSFTVVWRSGILQHSIPICKILDGFTINQDIKVFQPYNGVISDYVMIFLKTFEKEIRNKVVKDGTTVQSISSDSFYKIKIPVPSQETQQNIISFYEKYQDSIKSMDNNLMSSRLILKQILNDLIK